MKNEEELCEYDGPDRIVSSTEVRQELKDRPKNKVHFMSGMGTLDRLVEGFEGGELVVITGPTGAGKSTLGQTFTRNFSKQNLKTAWFTFEIPLPSFLEKMPEEIEFYVPRVLKPHDTNWIEERIVEAKLKYDTRAFMVDHLHYLLDIFKAGRQNLSLDIGMIIRQLKRVCVKHNIVLFLFCHATKATDAQGKPRDLGIGDLRDSSFIGQEADKVLIVQRLMDNDTGEYGNLASIKVAKDRRTGVMDKRMVVKKKGLLLEEVLLPGDAPSPEAKYFYEKKNEDEPLPF